jgi:uncharacterized membrane protein
VISAEVDFVVNRPVEVVFAFLSDFENNLKWRASQVEVEKTSDGPIGVGTTYRLVNNLLGRRVDLGATVVEFEPNRRFASRDDGPIPIEAQRIFEPVEGGTRVTLIVKAEPGGLLRIAEPLLGAILKRRLEADAAKAKDVLEARAV